MLPIMFVGPTTVGKTSIIKLYHEGVKANLSIHIPTLGLDFAVTTHTTSEGGQEKVKIWDTAGQERFRTLNHSCYPLNHGFALVFSLTDLNSFEQMNDMIDKIKEHGRQNVRIVLVGCKSDAVEERKVTKEAA